MGGESAQGLVFPRGNGYLTSFCMEKGRGEGVEKKGSGEGQQHHPKLNVWKRSEIWEEEMSL